MEYIIPTIAWCMTILAIVVVVVVVGYVVVCTLVALDEKKPFIWEDLAERRRKRKPEGHDL